MRHFSALVCVAASLSAAPMAAGGDEAHPEHGESHAAHHEHVAPHGGTLVVFGDEFAHLELTLDPKTGEMTAYVLDGEAERGLPVQQPSLKIEVQLEGEGARAFDVALAAVENVLTGETRGHTSQFAGRSDDLEGVRRFRGEVRRLEVKGQRFERVAFRFPEGNETHADAAEDGP